MSSLPIDTHDMLKYGRIRKEDIIKYYQDDDLFKYFEIISLNDDEFDLPHGQFEGMYQYSLDYGLGVDFKISLYDHFGSSVLTFHSNFETDHADTIIDNMPYDYEPISTDVDLGYRLFYKEYDITYRNQVKEIIQQDLPTIAKEILHHQTVLVTAYLANVDQIKLFLDMQFNSVEQPGPSKHQIYSWIDDYKNNIVKLYPYMLALQKP